MVLCVEGGGGGGGGEGEGEGRRSVVVLCVDRWREVWC